MVPYVIVAPPIEHAHTSAGVRALYILGDELVGRGCEVRMCEPERSIEAGDTIVVYPETVEGNPLKAKRVIRWTLNKPGLLGGDEEYPESEWVWTWHPDFYDGPLLTVNTIDRGIFREDDTLKVFDTAYYGKGAMRGVERIPLTMHMPEIHRGNPPWPMEREDVGRLLRATKTLYTYDDCTALIDEALMCGCRVVLLPEERELTWADTGHEADEVHAERIDAFVRETQERWG